MQLLKLSELERQNKSFSWLLELMGLQKKELKPFYDGVSYIMKGAKMSRAQSKATKEALTRIKMIYTEVDKYLKKLPPSARMTMGDLAEEFAARFQLRVNDVKPLISFYFHVKYDIGDDDFMLRRGRTGGIQKIPQGVSNHGP